MDFRDYAMVLRKRLRLISVATLVGVALAFAATLAATPQYLAGTQLFVSTSTGQGDTTNGLQQGGRFAQERVISYAAIVDSPPVTEAVIAKLQLGLTPRELAAAITTQAPPDTVLINVGVTDEDPAVAQAIANAVAVRFTEVVSELETPEGQQTSPVKVSVVRPADLPASPVSPRPALNVAIGLLVGLAVGVAAAVVREALDTSVKNPEEVQDLLQLPTLGMIAFDPDAGKRPLIVHVDPQSARAEAFRQLRTNLQFIDVDVEPRSIVITSSVPQEGKTTTACNLALALTQAGLSVILVEADLRRPRLAQYLGLEGAVGLTNVLVGRVSLDDALQTWSDPGLRVLASGPPPPNPSELLGSQQMGDLLQTLESMADLVILDAPPLLPVTDAAVLSTHASGAIVIVRSGRTTRQQVSRAVGLLRSLDVQEYGVVLNMISQKGAGGYQGGYQGYSYNTSLTAAATVLPGDARAR